MLSDGHTLYTPGLSENKGGTSRYYSNDRLGNLWTIDSSSKGQLDYQNTTGFGTTLSQGGSGSVFGFGGENGCQTDADTGLVLMGHRYYDSRIGRFLSQDPAGDGDNWYAYAGNSPTNEVDPTGLDAVLSFPMDGPGSSPVGSPGYSNIAGAATAGAFYDNEILTQYTLIHTWLQDDKLGTDALFHWVDRPGSDTWTLDQSSLEGAAGGAEVGQAAPEELGTLKATQNPMKDAARAALKKLNATEKQLASANRAISRATSSSKIAIKKEMENIVVNVTRAGRNGYQVFENVIDQNGSKQVIQKAYDELGNMVHFDPK